jgi:hypothetical protein
VRTVDDSTCTRVPGDVPRRSRNALVLAATTSVLAGCYGGDDPAATDHLGFEDGVSPVEDSLTTLETVLIYGLTPLVIMLVIAALVWLPGMVRSSRYRPARGWTAPPLWFGGPADPAAAVESASTGDLVRGGASGSW